MQAINQVSYQEVKDWEESGKDFKLLDVREAWERESFNIGGEWIPMDDFLKETPELPSDRPIVLYCEKGIRSAICIQRLSKRLPDIRFYNLRNGISHLKPS